MLRRRRVKLPVEAHQTTVLARASHAFSGAVGPRQNRAAAGDLQVFPGFHDIEQRRSCAWLD
jgi:hypothetical protein